MNNEIVYDIQSGIRELEYDVNLRNDYINTRDFYVYGDGLLSRLDIEDGHDITMYNYLSRVVDIQTAQLMGRPFNVYSYFNKEDISVYEPDSPDYQQALLNNKKRKAAAGTRKRVVDAIIRDNGGHAIFKDGARIGSAYGLTAYKMWRDSKKKRINISKIETPQNLRVFWSDSDFRDWDAIAYVWENSLDKANRDYGKFLKPGEMFEVGSMVESTGGTTSDPLDQNKASLDKRRETDRPMVTVIEYTGYRKGWAPQGDTLVEVKPGEEKPFSVLIVGGHVVQVISDEKRLPKYYLINNRTAPRRAWGESDISQSLIEINETIVQLMSDEITWANKNLYKLIQAKGFTPENIPRKKPRRTQVVPMAPEQSLEEMQASSQPLTEYGRLHEQLMSEFVRLAGVGRVLFDDPTINANSNQALITTLKGVIDIVEDKQSRWEPVLQQMFTDALELAAEDIPELKAAIMAEEDWFLCIEWPSVLRREDATYQTMWLNLFNAGVISLDTYQEKIGIPDTTEEIDRIRDNMADPITAAVLGHQLGELAAQKIAPPTPQGPDVKVSLRGDLTPGQEAELAAQKGFNSTGEMGPQGNQGLAAYENADNVGFLTGNPYQGGTPITQKGSQGSSNPQLTADQNNPDVAQAASQPGSGATPTSAAGAVRKTNQNRGY